MEPVRSDPRNHTIHVIEFLTFENLVFAVMPKYVQNLTVCSLLNIYMLHFLFYIRWDDDALVAEFQTVEELMHCSENFLEVWCSVL